MNTIFRKIMSYLVLGLLAAGLSGCAAGWFAEEAATGAVATHEYDEHHK